VPLLARVHRRSRARATPPRAARVFFLGAVGPSLARCRGVARRSCSSRHRRRGDPDRQRRRRALLEPRRRAHVPVFAPTRSSGAASAAIVPQDVLASGELERDPARARPGRVGQQLTSRAASASDGVERWCSLTRTPLRDAHGQSRRLDRDPEATSREQRRTEAELARSRTLAAVGEMSAKIAHEIKNPLAGIYAAVQVLSREVAAAATPTARSSTRSARKCGDVDADRDRHAAFLAPGAPQAARPTSLRVDRARRGRPAASGVFRQPNCASKCACPTSSMLADRRAHAEPGDSRTSSRTRCRPPTSKGTRVIVESRIEPRGGGARGARRRPGRAAARCARRSSSRS
jgi:hypothetical protein